MVLCMTNYGMLKFWKSASRCDGKTWAEKRADECVCGQALADKGNSYRMIYR